jgi:hypothetical protein
MGTRARREQSSKVKVGATRAAKRRAKARDVDAAGGAQKEAAPRRKAPSRPSRVKRYSLGDESALREAVRVECLKQFERRFGRSWDVQLERAVRGDSARFADLQEAAEVHEQLRAAIARAVEFVKRPRSYAPPLGLGSWVPRFIAPLADHDFLRKRELPLHAQHLSAPSIERQRLVAKLDAVDFLAAGRRLDTTEFAIVWLLGGGWPESLAVPESGITPSRVIQAEARAFRAAVREAGTNVARPAYRARFEQNEAGHWSASVRIDAERTAVAEGRTLDEAHRRLRVALAQLLDEERDSSATSRI